MKVVSENTPNAKAGNGEAFIISHVFESVSNGEKVYIRHKSGSSKSLHSLIEILTLGQWRFTSYAGATYSNDGVLLDNINRKSSSPTLLDSKFYHTPVIIDIGTPRLSFVFGGGNNPSRARSSNASDPIESVFDKDADVLIELENLGGGTTYCSYVFNVHEEA